MNWTRRKGGLKPEPSSSFSVLMTSEDTVYGLSCLYVIVPISIKGELWTRSWKAFLASSYTFSDLFWPFLFFPVHPPHTHFIFRIQRSWFIGEKGWELDWSSQGTVYDLPTGLKSNVVLSFEDLKGTYYTKFVLCFYLSIKGWGIWSWGS